MDDHEMTATGLSAEFDQLSLHQTLLDFEIASARVRDLTARLVGATHEVGILRRELARMAAEQEKLRGEYERMVQSQTYRVARVIVAVRRFLTR